MAAWKRGRLNWHLAWPGLVIIGLGIAVILCGIIGRRPLMILGGCLPLVLGWSLVKLAAFHQEITVSDGQIRQHVGSWRSEHVWTVGFDEVREVLIHGAGDDEHGMFYNVRVIPGGRRGDDDRVYAEP